MLKIVNKNGKEVIFDSQLPFLITEFKDDGSKIDINGIKLYKQNGEQYIDNSLDIRQLTLKFLIGADNRIELDKQRHFINSVLNPTFGEVIIIKDNKFIKGIVDALPLFDENSKVDIGLWESKVRFVCSSPYWNDITTNQSELSNFINKLEFPVIFDSDGIEFGGEGKNITIENNGDVETPLKIKFIGEMKNPKLINKTTNEFIKIEYNLSNSDNLLIDTSLENRKVTLNNQNAYGILSLDSTLFQLSTGLNEISFENESNNNAKVILEYNNKFISI